MLQWLKVKFAYLWRAIQIALWMWWEEEKMEHLPYGTLGCFFGNPVDGGDEPIVKGRKVWRWGLD